MATVLAIQYMYDAILLYNSRDLDHVSALFKYLKDERGLSVWFAEETLPPGQPLTSSIAQAIDDSRFTIVCIGPETSNYQGMELDAVFTRSSKPENRGRLIPVVLPGARLETNPFRPFIEALKWVDLRQSIHDKIALARLAAELLEKRRAAGVPDVEAAQIQPASAPQAPGSLLEDLAKNVAATGLTVFVGGTVPERHEDGVPNRDLIAQDLCEELNRKAPQGARPLPTMSAERAAFLYSLREGYDDAHNFTLQRHLQRSLGEPAAYAALGELFKELRTLRLKSHRTSFSVAPLLCITTNVDLSVERAFIRQELPFARIVFHHRDVKFSCLEISNVVRSMAGGFVLDGVDELTSRRPDELDGERRQRYEQEYRDTIREEHKLTFDRFVELRELNRIIFRIQQLKGTVSGQAKEDGSVDTTDLEKRVRELSHEQNDDPRSRTPRVILFKPYGSYDIRHSCAFSADQHHSFSRRMRTLPNALATAVQHNATLLIGLNLTEPSFVHLYETYLSDVFKNADSTRLALTQSPSIARDTQDRIDIAMSASVAIRSQKMFHLGVLERDPSGSVTELRKLVRSAGTKDTWFD